MGFTDQAIPTLSSPAAPPVPLPGDEDLPAEPATPRPPAKRLNWLFSGVLLGAASWMLVLGIVFAVIGEWIIAGALFGGIVLCGLAVWSAGRRLAGGHASGGHASGRHRAEDSADD
jgi:hypothetical protein